MDVTNTSTLQALDADAFLRLFVTQIRHQDPTNPMDPSQLTSQLAQLTTVQKMTELSETFQCALRTEQMGLATGLIGQSVGFWNNGTIEAGIVQAVTKHDDTVGVVVNNLFVPLEEVVEIYGTPEPAQEPGGEATS